MCITPIRIKTIKKTNVPVWESAYCLVPCGKCPDCKRKRANDWILRLEKEERIHSTALFVTLTYNNDNVPRSNNGFKTLDKKAIPAFIKRLRANTGIRTIKYYAVGEYGTNTWRPHYHLIIYDAPREAIEKAWCATNGRGRTRIYDTRKPIGDIHVGNVEGASLAYTTKYICKDKRIPQHDKDDRQPEFSLMSKNLGLNYITPSMRTWHINNMANYVVKNGGYKSTLPRYYRDRIFTEEQKAKLFIITQKRHWEQHHKQVEYYGGLKQFYKHKFEVIKLTYEKQRKNNEQSRSTI